MDNSERRVIREVIAHMIGGAQPPSDFDALTDVQAQEHPKRGRVSPAFAAMVGFTVAVIVVGGTVAIGLAVRSGDGPASSVPEPTTATSTAAPAITSSTTTIPPVESTTLPTSTTVGVASVQPVAASGWELALGDVLVADTDGVHQVRDGVVVARPVTSPAFVAVSDGLGGLIVQPVEADPPDPRHLPDGALELWRVTPDGVARLLYRSDVESHATDYLQLFDVVLIEEISPSPSLVMAEHRCVEFDGICFQLDFLVVLPLDGESEAIAVAAPIGSWEGGIGGVVWEPEAGGRFLVSGGAEGISWMSAWDLTGHEVAWPNNPNPHDQPTETLPTWAMTGIRPGLIAYEEQHAQEYSTGTDSPIIFFSSLDLVIYDTLNGTEEQRVAIDVAPWWYLHANHQTVAITSQAWMSEERVKRYLPVQLYDTLTGDLETLGVAGRATVVPPMFCCDAPVTPTDLVIEGTRDPYTFGETQAFGEFGPVLWGLVTTLTGQDDIPHGAGYEWVTWGPLWGGRLLGPTPHDVYGVTDFSAVDFGAIAAVIPRGQTIILREVRWSLDQLEDFKDDLNDGAPDNGVCSTGFGGTANRIRLVATAALDLGEVPLDAVAIETVDECPVYSNEPAVIP